MGAQKLKALRHLRSAYDHLTEHLEDLGMFQRKSFKEYERLHHFYRDLDGAFAEIRSAVERKEKDLQAFKMDFARSKGVRFDNVKSGSEEWFERYFKENPHHKELFAKRKRALEQEHKESLKKAEDSYDELLKKTEHSLERIEEKYEKIRRVFESMLGDEKTLREEFHFTLTYFQPFKEHLGQMIAKGHALTKEMVALMGHADTPEEDIGVLWEHNEQLSSKRLEDDYRMLGLELEETHEEVEKELEHLKHEGLDLIDEYLDEEEGSFRLLATKQVRKAMNHHLENKLLLHMAMMVSVARHRHSLNQSYRVLKKGVVDAKLDAGARALYMVEGRSIILLRLFSSAEHDHLYMETVSSVEEIERLLRESTQPLALFIPHAA